MPVDCKNKISNKNKANNVLLKKSSLFIFLQLAATTTFAANYGTDLNLTMMPAAGGMGGVGIASPQDLGASVFGNPATLTQFNGNQFLFGATFYDVNVEDKHNGGTTGTAWSGESEAGPYLVPNVALTQPINDVMTIGAGLTVVSGVGSDFRGKTGSLDPLAEVLVFGANAGLGYKVNENLSLGGMLTIGMGLGQAGLNSVTASTSNFGFRGTLGMNYKMGANSLGIYYKSPLAIEYENMVQYASNGFHSPTFEQPQEVGIGMSNSSLIGGKLLLAADIVWKDWSSAESYQDLYKDQTVFAAGMQYTHGSLKYRLGFSHANSPIKKNVGSSVGDITSIYLGGATVPMNPALTQYVQATNTEVVWENQVTAGLGYEITPVVSMDAHVAYAFKRDEQIGNTKVDAGAWQAGVGFTWKH
jgi:long-chain fatty acid transport protein